VFFGVRLNESVIQPIDERDDNEQQATHSLFVDGRRCEQSVVFDRVVVTGGHALCGVGELTDLALQLDQVVLDETTNERVHVTRRDEAGPALDFALVRCSE
jgi:hypothetical protein